MLAAQDLGDLAGEPSEHDAVRIDQNPFLLDLGGLGRVGLHGPEFQWSGRDDSARPRPRARTRYLRSRDRPVKPKKRRKTSMLEKGYYDTVGLSDCSG